MKATGIIRRIDCLGRLVIPKGIRERLCIREGDPLELYVGTRYVAFRKYDPTRSIKEVLEILKETVEDQTDLDCAVELHAKISEMFALLPDEADLGGVE